MDLSQHNMIVNFIWSIADDCLRDVYVRGKYRDVILPMIVIRRIDALLEPTKAAVLKLKDQLDKKKVVNMNPALCQTAGQAFYNTSPFLLRDLKSRTTQQKLKVDFESYLDGFSPNVQEILEKFQFRNQIPKMSEADILGSVIEKFANPDINLSPNPIYDTQGNIRMPALDNHSMGLIFEELIRRFNEENNEEAGEHFTPRDVIKLMAKMVFIPVAEKIESGTYLLYDGACGTGGMLTVAEQTLMELAKAQNKEVAIHLYGQEINPETFAITKADLLLKGEGSEAENMKFGSTLSSDFFPSKEFDFMLSNPPYGKSWKTDQDRMGGKGEISDPRFVIQYAGNPEYKMITRSSDGQMLFLVNKLAKMKNSTALGSRIAEVHNGSSLFTGDAGQGESNIRRWIIENDWLEAIVALPENMFYNTGISTYIWLLSNRKSPERKRKVQLVDASKMYVPLRKNLGKKNCEFSEEQINKITELIINPAETEESKIFPNEAFGYSKVIAERPLKLKDIDPEKAYSSKEIKEMIAAGKIDENGIPVIKKIHKQGTPDPLHGLFERIIAGKKVLVEYEPDTSLRDTEQIPLLEDGGIEAFFVREVLPYAPGAWIDDSKTQTGYEVSFTKYFYKPVQMRTLEEIVADIKKIEAETDGLLKEIIKD
ncbi:MAG: type I restriction-modification system subunit M [Bacteroidales bacterium]|jgi:type I restriction enzyme M protein|nr:type I restriction-modification system subunit M [Bacteroidales bacterium]